MVLKVRYKDGRVYWVEVDEVYMPEEKGYIEVKTSGEQRRTIINLENTDAVLDNEVIWRRRNKQLEETMSKIRTILEEAVYLVESKEIYAHGFPEARLMPPNFKEDCEERFLEWANEEVNDIVNSYLESVVYTNG